jgi:DNA helicase IV
MLQEVEQKLNDVVCNCDLDFILIEHDENDTTYIGVHELYGHNNEEHHGVSWSEEPIFYAETVEDLQKKIAKFSDLMEKKHVVTEVDLQQFNWNLQKKKVF